MHPQEMDEVLAEIITGLLAKEKSKRKQYGISTNGLARIDRCAEEKSRSPEEQIFDLAGKHHEGEKAYGMAMSKGGDWKAFDETLSVSIPPLKIGETYTRRPGDGIKEIYEDQIIYKLLALCCLHRRMKGKE